MNDNTSKDWLTVKEFCGLYRGRLGRTLIYERLRDGSLPCVRVGNKFLIPADALDRLMARDTGPDDLEGPNEHGRR